MRLFLFICVLVMDLGANAFGYEIDTHGAITKVTYTKTD